jgi:predicted amidohydrolase
MLESLGLRFRLLLCCALGGWTVSDLAPSQVLSRANAAEPLLLKHCEPWAPIAIAAPITGHASDDHVSIEGNGTRTCCGGWQFLYMGVTGKRAYRIRTRAEYQGLAHARDSLVALVLYDAWSPSQVETGQRPCNYLLPSSSADDAVDFEAVVVPPEGTTRMTVRYIFRWAEHGRSRWTMPRIEPAALPEKKPVKICVVSPRPPFPARTEVRPLSRGLGLPDDVARSVDVWGSLILAACERKPQLIVTPELVIGGKGLVEGSVTVPGPAMTPFQAIAREHKVHLVLGTKQRDGDGYYNSAVVIGPQGEILGVYHKVHLATSEGLSGLSAGDSFPVFDTGIGRLGCLICMDTTVSESARMLALNGADIICFPIMGDLRADRFSPGPPIFQEGRWKAIMRTRALDNQLCMVVARNEAQGSCIIDRKGDILAWNEGDQEVIEATLPPEDGYRVWDGTDFREVTSLLRRPHLYGAYTNETIIAPLRRPNASSPPAPKGTSP